MNMKDAAEQVGVSRVTFAKYLREGRVLGAHKAPGAREWTIPAPVKVLDPGFGYRVAAEKLGISRSESEWLFKQGGVRLATENNLVSESNLEKFKNQVTYLAQRIGQS